ncbi:MAG: hypothetical protein LC641_06845 [Spirochaeta sp.]|nr:hypothetical protein [Spirochaeta sp.]
MRRNQALQILDALAAATKVPTVLFMVNSAGGSAAYEEALGAERVMLGFPYPSGERDGPVMRMVPVNDKKVWKIAVGEADGRVTERTCPVAEVLRSMRGYKVEIRRDMDAWLKNHVALLMTALAPAIYAANIDVGRLARTRDLLVLSVRGIRGARGVHRIATGSVSDQHAGMSMVMVGVAGVGFSSLNLVPVLFLATVQLQASVTLMSGQMSAHE